MSKVQISGRSQVWCDKARRQSWVKKESGESQEMFCRTTPEKLDTGDHVKNTGLVASYWYRRPPTYNCLTYRRPLIYHPPTHR